MISILTCDVIPGFTSWETVDVVLESRLQFLSDFVRQNMCQPGFEPKSDVFVPCGHCARLIGFESP